MVLLVIRMCWRDKMAKKKKKNHLKKSTYLFIILDTLAFACFFLAYGPFSYFRNLFVNTALKTMNHKYFAYVLYSDRY